MTQTLDEIEVSNRTLELIVETLLLPEAAPPPIEADFLGAGSPLLVFAPAPAFPAPALERTGIAGVQAAPADLPAPRVRPRRRFRVDWYEAAVVALILGCAALSAYRLLWAIQP